MTCKNKATCDLLGALPMDATTLAGNKNVTSIVSSTTGVITIKYKPTVVPAAKSDLVIAPVGTNGTTALLLNSTAAAGSQVNWACGTGSAAATSTLDRSKISSS